MKSVIAPWVIVLLSVFFAAPGWAHNGSHETKSCALAVGDYPLRLSGYQFQGLHPDAVYCRIFPFLGTVLFKVEAVDSQTSQMPVTLQLMTLQGRLVKRAAFTSFKTAVILSTAITQRGLYALDIVLYAKPQPLHQRRYVLIGIPVTELLVLLSGGLLLLMIGILLHKWRLNLRRR